jgi:hypothetical protein
LASLPQVPPQELGAPVGVGATVGVTVGAAVGAGVGVGVTVGQTQIVDEVQRPLLHFPAEQTRSDGQSSEVTQVVLQSGTGLGDGDGDGDLVGTDVGDAVGLSVGVAVGACVGVGDNDGEAKLIVKDNEQDIVSLARGQLDGEFGETD